MRQSLADDTKTLIYPSASVNMRAINLAFLRVFSILNATFSLFLEDFS